MRSHESCHLKHEMWRAPRRRRRGDGLGNALMRFGSAQEVRRIARTTSYYEATSRILCALAGEGQEGGCARDVAYLPPFLAFPREGEGIHKQARSDDRHRRVRCGGRRSVGAGVMAGERVDAVRLCTRSAENRAHHGPTAKPLQGFLPPLRGKGRKGGVHKTRHTRPPFPDLPRRGGKGPTNKRAHMTAQPAHRYGAAAAATAPALQKTRLVAIRML